MQPRSDSIRSIAWRIALELALLVGCSSCTPILACGPPPPCSRTPSYTRAFSFESLDCNGPLCGFTVESGNARIVGALHPGEHGLLLESGTTIRTLFSATSAPRASESIELVGRCDSGATLVAVEDLSTASGTRTARAVIPATTDWTALTATFADVGTGIPAGSTVRPTGLAITVGGTTGTCTIDEVLFVASANRCASDFRDAGSDVRRDAPLDARNDASFDGFSDARGDGSPLRSGCARNADCGSGETCLTTFPGGFCTRRCTSIAGCWSGTVCDATALVCVPACTPGGRECEPFGGACATSTAGPGQCVPACFTVGAPGTPPGYPSCVPGTVCDPYRGTCGSIPSVGAESGEPCTNDSACRGNHCVTETDLAGIASGWIGGYCASLGRVPDSTAYVVGSPVPQSTCPPGSGVVPLHGESQGAVVECLKTCNVASDCRAGYQCDHRLSAMGGAPFFSNGVCVPIDCAIAGATCPAGYACQIPSLDAAAASGVCAADSDGGVASDAGMDASGTD